MILYMYKEHYKTGQNLFTYLGIYLCVYTHTDTYICTKIKEKEAMGLRERESREGKREIAKKGRWERLKTGMGKEK